MKISATETQITLHGLQSALRPVAKKAPDANGQVLAAIANVQISAAGKSRAADDGHTPAEAQLAANQDELAAKKAKKEKAAALETRIASDDTLTDEDKAALRKEADALKQEGMTDEDRLYEAYDKKNELEKRLASGEKTLEEISGPMNFYNEQIETFKERIAKQAAEDTALRTKAVQQRGDADAAALKQASEEAAAQKASVKARQSARTALAAYQQQAARLAQAQEPEKSVSSHIHHTPQ